MIYEDSDEPILDETRDGHSVYYNARGNGRIIRPSCVAEGEWEVVS